MQGKEAKQKKAEAELDDTSDQIVEEIQAMAEYAYGGGYQIPDKVASGLMKIQQSEQATTLDILTEVHNGLADIVSPAKPRSLAYIRSMQSESNKSFFSLKWLGPIPIIRQMVLASFVSLLFFVTLTVFGESNTACAESENILWVCKNKFFVALSLIAAAATGASFANLYGAYDYVAKGTFDPSFNVSYWVRFILGLTAGYILAELVLEFISIAEEDKQYSKPLAALLGGFSAQTVYRILERLVESLGSIVDGSIKQKRSVIEKELQTQAASAALRRKTDLLRDLSAFKQEMTMTTGDDSQTQKRIDAMIDKILNE